MEVLKLACRAAGLNKDALQEALKDAAVRAQMEVLKKRETELEAEVMDEWAVGRRWGASAWVEAPQQNQFAFLFVNVMMQRDCRGEHARGSAIC